MQVATFQTFSNKNPRESFYFELRCLSCEGNESVLSVVVVQLFFGILSVIQTIQESKGKGNKELEL